VDQRAGLEAEASRKIPIIAPTGYWTPVVQLIV